MSADLTRVVPLVDGGRSSRGMDASLRKPWDLQVLSDPDPLTNLWPL